MASIGDPVGTEANQGGNPTQGPSLQPEPSRAEAQDNIMDGQLRTEESPPGPSHQGTVARTSPASRKRKSPEYDPEFSPPADPRCGDGSKKVKLAEDHEDQPDRVRVGLDKSLLPPEIWHHIFTFCPPKSLGNLLRVNKLFNHYLDQSSSAHREVPLSVAKSALASLKPNAIWRASRRLFWPQMPAPLRSRPEIDMWRLACSPRCQNCNKLHNRERLDAPGPGPGVEGVAVIWPFAIRVCGPCLLQKSIKQIDLLLSPSIPSAILTALPFVYLTRELHILPASTAEQEQLPAGQQATKLFLRSDVEHLEQEFSTVKGMGSGTVDEWLKGLDSRGKNARQQASKWEKWDSSGGVVKMLSELYPGYQKTSSRLPQALNIAPAVAPIPVTAVTVNPTLPRLPPPPFSHGRQERSVEEVARLKAARKAEIERRALLLLNPPLTANVLRHIPSFQAATHIITPLDDSAWELLKPRLLAQRAEAELREKQIVSETKPIPEPVDHHPLEMTLATTKEARELIDKDWEIVQAPLRATIAGYADDIIRDAWDNGKKVTKDTCPKFAVDVLVYVRREFYADIAQHSAAAIATGQQPIIDPLDGPFTQKLTLENMKWIFDTKIKPYTEPYRKELFYCNSCDGNLKTFGFEGVIQHYAAKHTTSLSLGSIVVHWRAEWPEYPPFSPEARLAKAGFYSPAPPFTGNTVPPSAGYNYPFSAGPAAPPTYPPPASFGAPVYGDPYQHQAPNPPYQPQTTYPAFTPPNFGQQPPYVTQQAPYQPYPPPVAPYSAGSADPGSSYNPHGPAHAATYPPYQNNTQGPYPPAVPPPYVDSHVAKLEDIARNSREVWQALGTIRDLPGSARLFVTIHHLVKRYRSRFHETPLLSLFIDGLANNKEMRPVRNINGLVCKACHLGLGNAAFVEQERKSFSVPQLTNHFHSKHVAPMQTQGGPPLDWVTDMVMLMDQDKIPNLRHFVSEYQRSLLSDAFPGIFEPQAHHPRQTTSHHGGNYGDPYAQALNPPAGGIPGGNPGAEGRTFHEQPPRPYGTNNPTNTGQSQQYIPQPVETRASESYLEPGYAVGGAGGGVVLSRTLNEVHTPQNGNGRDSVEDHQPRSDQSSQHSYRKGNGKNKRRKQKDGGDRGRSASEEGVEKRRDVSGERYKATWGRYPGRHPFEGESRLGAMSPMDRDEVARTFSPRGPDRSGNRSATHAPPPVYQSANGDPRHFQAPPSQDEPNLLGALERHLDQGEQLPPNPAPGHVSGDPFYAEDRRSTAVERGDFSRSYARPRTDMDRPMSPYGSQYRPRDRQSPTGYYAEPSSHPKPEHIERYEAPYEPYRSQPDPPGEMPSQRWEDERYNRPPQFDRDYGSESHQESYRYPERTPPRARPPIEGPPVEAYEIVQVIDERGEYYIRRPVRREPLARYAPEQNWEARRGVNTYANQEPYYLPAPARGGSAREPAGPAAPRNSRPVDNQVGHRGDPAFYEEYDPRYPSG